MKTRAINILSHAAVLTAAAMSGLAYADGTTRSGAERALSQHIHQQISDLGKSATLGGSADTILGLPAMAFYGIVAVLGLLTIAAVVVVIICATSSKKKAPQPLPPPEFGPTETTEFTEELPPPPPAPKGPGLSLSGSVNGLGVRVGIRYSELKEMGNHAVVGRHAGNWLVVDEPTVSGEHASIFAQNGSFWVRDCGSRCGTSLNGAPLQKESMPLQDGDTLVLSSHITLHVKVRKFD